MPRRGRICILAFDGLEAEYVERWGHENLLQEVHGIYPSSSKLNSIQLWTSFLTGLPPHKHGQYLFIERSFRPKSELLRKIGKAVLGRFLKGRPPSVKGKMQTIFEYARRPLPFNVLCYNEKPEQFELRLKYDLGKTIGDVDKSIRAFHDWMEFSEKLAGEFQSLLVTKEWDLAMTHFWFTDLIGHLFGKSWLRMRMAYGFADFIAKCIADVLREEDLILIVSDHGMKKGMHTDHGFYSFNKEVDFRPRRIEDFHYFVRGMLDG